ncbi:MAG: L-ribulose-5-phosphate 4-epimerase AraD [Acidobacteria bacterium]|nr:L-ribulose-5-phosphate 4-epimerase AraD [Acidobacteriota bacterium]MBU4254441.1 L-ribulose-5-phosphate 4-epimerase AraD [Acidobacteriota bacterium]MBU4329204.1 L-ribulose-5-phosphate 4-epimerase AraD [Acidobacteriota bacterium]MCG2816414.1 L-ribulose-5-phosphate 4-epimerase AraD [Candidatus Aminicenantes bacterium]
MTEKLKDRVWAANCGLVKHDLVFLTWGNVSGFDPDSGFMAIKPSGVSFEELKARDIVLVDKQGRAVEKRLKPSSDTPTHLILYENLKGIGGIVHTHSPYATMFAQAKMPIPALGTTHADCFSGEVPVTRWLTEDEVREDYEGNTGHVLVETLGDRNPFEMSAVLFAGHGPFCWGGSPEEALENAVALEAVARMAWGTLALRPEGVSLPGYLFDKHYKRKHGPGAYYGQPKKGEDQ